MKTKPWIERGRRYENDNDFFDLDGSVVMRLTRVAAIQVCSNAASRNILVARIEGGNWKDPYYVSRLDCIWDGADPPISVEDAEVNNAAARQFLELVAEEFDVFIITAPSILGWKHHLA
jgi:hypothetical protein